MKKQKDKNFQLNSNSAYKKFKNKLKKQVMKDIENKEKMKCI